MNATNLSSAANALAPPSFAGMDWLLVINLTAVTFGLLVISRAAYDTTVDWREEWRNGTRGSAAEITLRVVALIFWGGTCRLLSDALSLYGWNPVTQSSGGWATAGRFLDPLGVVCFATAAIIWLLTRDGLIEQARVKPLHFPLWEGRETVLRMCAFAIIALGVALCPVIFR